MLTVHRKQRRAVAGDRPGHHFARRNQRFLVGEADNAAVLNGSHGRAKAGAADDGGDGHVGGPGGGLGESRAAAGALDVRPDEQFPQLRQAALIGYNGQLGGKFPC